MLLYLTLFTGLSLFILLRSLFHGLIHIIIPPTYTVRSVETAGFISDSYLKTRRLVWLDGVKSPIRVVAELHPHEGDECVSKEYWLGSKLLHAKVICLASRSSGELCYLDEAIEHLPLLDQANSQPF